MTARQIYHRALALIQEQDTDGVSYDTEAFRRSAPEMINLLCVLLDDLDLKIKGKAFRENELLPREVKSEDDEVPLHPVILAGALPLGLAFLLLAEEDASRASLFFNLFQKEKEALYRRFKRGTRRAITRVY